MRERFGFFRIIIIIGICCILLFILYTIGAASRKNLAVELQVKTAYSSFSETPLFASPSAASTGTIFQLPINSQPTPNANVSLPSVCANIWGIEPPAELPAWLGTPQNVSGLHTEIKYFILAGKLISTGIVNAADCPSRGISIDGVATTCGMEKAFPQVVYWQNQFDQEILTAAQKNEIPAQVMKRLFAQETQFWPPTSLSPPAYGVGNVTSPGIEPLFTWYGDIYQNTCRAIFSHTCEEPYHALSLENQQLLRGFFISQNLHAYCPTCPNHVDIEKIKSSIDFFAKLLVANCHQADLILVNHGYSPSEFSYKDAWRLTLANYTIGAGCVTNALEDMDRGKSFSWGYFISQLNPGCSVDIYVNNITGR